MKHILIINLGGIGDLLLSTPALRALRKAHPEAEISVLASARVYEIVKNLSYIDNVFIFNIEYGRIVPFSKIIRNLKVLLSLRNKHVDIAINMRTLVSKKSARKIKILLDVIKPKIKVGRDTEGRGYFFDITIPETDIGTKHETEYNIDTVKALGVEIIDKTIVFDIDEASTDKIKNILEKEGISKETTLIGLHPGGRPSRRWPVENFVKTIENIDKRMSCMFVVTGGKDEIGLAEELVNKSCAKVISLAGKLSIKQLGALIKRCNLFISNDTAPMHISAVLRTPLAAILGPGDIVHYDPRNISKQVIVFYKKADCSPCTKIRCDSMGCLKEISPEEVAEAALGSINHEHNID